MTQPRRSKGKRKGTKIHPGGPNKKPGLGLSLKKGPGLRPPVIKPRLPYKARLRIPQ
jgi:hypothetical protein